MRKLVLLPVLLMTFSCAPAFDGCVEICTGGQQGSTQFLCDGGPCPVGGATATEYDQCLCALANGQFESYVYSRPQTQTDCDAARSAWSSFSAANCH